MKATYAFRLPAIRAAQPSDTQAVRALLEEYARSLDFDLCFQGFAAELAGLPGAYAPPRGSILLAEIDGEAAGVVALRPLERSVCEMKRLYVRPQARGRGLGLALASGIIGDARRAGYVQMRLDTARTMAGAITLYRSLGFVEIPAYGRSPKPKPELLYFELALAPPVETPA